MTTNKSIYHQPIYPWLLILIALVYAVGFFTHQVYTQEVHNMTYLILLIGYGLIIYLWSGLNTLVNKSRNY